MASSQNGIHNRKIGKGKLFCHHDRERDPYGRRALHPEKCKWRYVQEAHTEKMEDLQHHQRIHHDRARGFQIASMPLDAANRMRTLWLLRDLFPHIPMSEGWNFRSCYRLVARRQMLTNLDHVFWEHSRVEVAE